MASKSNYKFCALVLTIALSAFYLQAEARFSPQQQKPASSDTIHYPINDRRGDPFTYHNRNSFDLRDTAFIKRSIEYDPKTKQYFIIEKIGNNYYRTPTTFSMQEFLDMQGKQDEENY